MGEGQIVRGGGVGGVGRGLALGRKRKHSTVKRHLQSGVAVIPCGMQMGTGIYGPTVSSEIDLMSLRSATHTFRIIQLFFWSQ